MRGSFRQHIGPNCWSLAKARCSSDPSAPEHPPGRLTSRFAWTDAAGRPWPSEGAASPFHSGRLPGGTISSCASWQVIASSRQPPRTTSGCSQPQPNACRPRGNISIASSTPAWLHSHTASPGRPEIWVTNVSTGGSEQAGSEIAQATLTRLGAAASSYTGDYRVGTSISQPVENAPDPPPLVSQQVTTAHDLARILSILQAAALGQPAALHTAGLTEYEARVGSPCSSTHSRPATTAASSGPRSANQLR
jgi:hypothetical protein